MAGTWLMKKNQLMQACRCVVEVELYSDPSSTNGQRAESKQWLRKCDNWRRRLLYFSFSLAPESCFLGARRFCPGFVSLLSSRDTSNQGGGGFVWHLLCELTFLELLELGIKPLMKSCSLHFIHSAPLGQEAGGTSAVTVSRRTDKVYFRNKRALQLRTLIGLIPKWTRASCLNG